MDAHEYVGCGDGLLGKLAVEPDGSGDVGHGQDRRDGAQHRRAVRGGAGWLHVCADMSRWCCPSTLPSAITTPRSRASCERVSSSEERTGSSFSEIGSPCRFLEAIVLRATAGGAYRGFAALTAWRTD